MKAHDVFDQAPRWAAEDLGADTAEFDYWIAECMIREGDAAERSRCSNTRSAPRTRHGSALMLPRLHRGIGYARLALGDHDAAHNAFESAVAAAREQSSPFEVRARARRVAAHRAVRRVAAEHDAPSIVSVCAQRFRR